MRAFYKHFALLGIVFCMGLPVANAQDAAPPLDPYTVEGVEVDVTAKNAVEARTTALDQAQVKAYRMWLEKNLSADVAAAYPDPDPVAVGAMVQDFEVTNESISAVRYKGVFTVRFRPSALRRLMPAAVDETVPYAAEADYYTPASSPYTAPKEYMPATSKLVIPYFQSGRQTVLWEGGNPLRAAWARLPVMADNISLPLGDLTDVSLMADDQPLTYPPDNMVRLLERYRAAQAAILIGSANPAGGVDVNIYAASPGARPQFVRLIQIMPAPGASAQMVFDQAVAQVKPVIATLRPALTEQAAAVPASVNVQPAPAPAGPAQTYKGRVHFNSVQEWVKLKNTLDRMPGMQAVMVKTLSPKMAEIDMRFSGDPAALAAVVGRAGMTLKTTPAPTAASTGVSMDSAYDLFGGMTPF